MTSQLLLTLALLTPIAQQPYVTDAELQRRGVAALKEDQPETAAAAFEELLKRGLTNPFVHHNLGVAYQRQRRHNEAAEQFGAALQLDNSSVGSRALLGASLLALGRVDESVTLLEMAAHDLPDDLLIREQLAKAYQAQGKYLKSLWQHQELVRLKPEDPEALYQLARAYQRVSEWSYSRMTELEPQSPRVQQALAQTYLTQGKLDEAARALESAVTSNPDLPELHLTLAYVYVRQGKLDQAMKAVENELALAPSNRGALELKRQLLSRIGQR